MPIFNQGLYLLLNTLPANPSGSQERITQDGTERITENGTERITENG